MQRSANRHPPARSSACLRGDADCEVAASISKPRGGPIGSDVRDTDLLFPMSHMKTLSLLSGKLQGVQVDVH